MSEAFHLETIIQIGDKIVYEFCQQWVQLYDQAEVNAICWNGNTFMNRHEIFRHSIPMRDISRQAAVQWHFDQLSTILNAAKDSIRSSNHGVAQLLGEFIVIEVNYVLIYNVANCVRHSMTTTMTEKSDHIELMSIQQDDIIGTHLIKTESLPIIGRYSATEATIQWHQALSGYMKM